MRQIDRCRRTQTPRTLRTRCATQGVRWGLPMGQAFAEDVDGSEISYLCLGELLDGRLFKAQHYAENAKVFVIPSRLGENTLDG